ncbi:hypothetical protein GW17_00061089 [Ensete ventricosum]|nr:hypothetical protein GW17_00061089 [Ensete ventricosum]
MAISKLQALSNGRYKSVWHRAVVNSEKERMSIASFLCPCNCAIISPPEKLISEASPAMYRSYTYEEYYKNTPSQGLKLTPQWQRKQRGIKNIRQPTMYYSSSSTASLQKPSELPMLHIIIISHFRRMPKAASRWAPQQKRGRLCVVRPKSSEIRAQFF